MGLYPYQFLARLFVVDLLYSDLESGGIFLSYRIKVRISVSVSVRVDALIVFGPSEVCVDVTVV
jgi:hypothetical protein